MNVWLKELNYQLFESISKTKTEQLLFLRLSKQLIAIFEVLDRHLTELLYTQSSARGCRPLPDPLFLFLSYMVSFSPAIVWNLAFFCLSSVDIVDHSSPFDSTVNME